jgi:peptidoglycan/LPS O-acetylase OafA/YrhL
MFEQSPQSVKTSIEPLDYLMVLRGLSALAVVFCHLPFELHKCFSANGFLAINVGNKLDWLLDPFGYIPVLIFFSLSGYLITLGFFTGRHNPTTLQGVITYYRSRVFRILPLYYFSILLCVILYWRVAQHNLWRVAALFVFTENYKPMHGIIFNHVYWTMPVEMLYFLMAPLIYIGIHKLMKTAKKWVVYCGLSIIFLTIVLWVFKGVPSDDSAYILTRKNWSLIARFDFIYNLMAFVLGGAGVFIVKNPQYQLVFTHYRRFIKYLACLLILLLTAYCSTIGLTQLDGGRVNYVIAYALIPCIAFFVLCVAILHETQVVRQRAFAKYFIHLGVLSYGVYLFHMPVYETLQLWFTRSHIVLTNEAISISTLCFTLLLSQLSYTYVELPFLRQRRL